MRYLSLIILLCNASSIFAQDDLLNLVEKTDAPSKQYVSNAFKSSRVINNQSMEFIGKGVLDVRILHRFGPVSSGLENLYGLDQANMRFGFDYGLMKSLSVGIGRSNVGKEWDGFIKYRPVWQSTGGKWSSPVSVILITGATIGSASWSDPTRKNYFSSRMAFYNEIILGRKFTEQFSLQLSPTYVHRNLVTLAADKNDAYAIGIGTRYKISKRTAFVIDYDYIVNGVDKSLYKNPLSVGFDIETGGHVFQLHFSNSTGMNEKAFLTNTTNSWSKGEIRFGFNLSRVFTVKK